MNNIKRGNVYIVDLKEVNSEFNGFFPVLILQNDKGNKFCETTFGVLIDVSEKRGRSYIPIEAKGLHCDSKILCNKPVSFEKKRISRFLFTLDEKKLKQVEAVFTRKLGLNNLMR